jgi:hypothetical protein
VAEIVSDADEFLASGASRRWIDLERGLLRNHEFCCAIALVREDRMEVTLEIRERGRRASTALQGADARLSIASLGL